MWERLRNRLTISEEYLNMNNILRILNMDMTTGDDCFEEAIVDTSPQRTRVLGKGVREREGRFCQTEPACDCRTDSTGLGDRNTRYKDDPC